MGREHGAGATAGMCGVTSARQYLLAVFSICNSKLDPGARELGLLFSWSLGLQARASSHSASALLSPKRCSSHLNKPTCRRLLGKVNASEAALAPASPKCEEHAVLPSPAIFTCPPQVRGSQTPPHREEEKGFFNLF